MTEASVRILRFPTDHSVGKLQLLQSGTFNSEMKPAQGEIEVPEGWDATLVLGEDEERDLNTDVSGLDFLGAGDLQALRVSRIEQETDLSIISRLTELERLTLPDGTNDQQLRVLEGLSNLSQLNLQSSSITDEGLDALSRLTNLKSLRTHLPGITGLGLNTLAKLPLENLTLDAVRLTDDGLSHVGKVISLQTLSIASDEVSDEGLSHLQALASLTRLSIASPKIAGPGLYGLGSLKELRALSLAGCSIEDKFVAALQRFEKLEELDLSRTAITDYSLGIIAGFTVPLRSVNLGGRVSMEAKLRLLPGHPGLYLDGVRYSPRAASILADQTQ